MNIDAFESLAFKRASVRNFKPDPVSRDLLDRLLRITQRTPSSYNLQPVHYYVVRQQQMKEAMLNACIGQRQVLSAPAIVVFAADRDAAQHNLDRVFEADSAAGAIPEEKKEIYHHLVDMNFSRKPFGFGWITKAFFAPLLKLFTPLPELPAVYKRAWVEKHVGLAAMSFMFAAESAGLATCAMSGFDEGRIKKALKIPKGFDVPMIVTVGYPAERHPLRTRLPFEEVVHWL